MHKRYLSLAVLLVVLSAVGAQAQVPAPDPTIVSAYRNYKDPVVPTIIVPTVVELPFAEDVLERYDFAVFNKTTGAFEPHYFKQRIVVNQSALSVTANSGNTDSSRMLDDDTRTYASFEFPDLPNVGVGEVTLTLTSPLPISSSALTLVLDDNVALPTTVSIRADVNGRDTILVAPRKMEGATVRFPRTLSSRFSITLNYSQPLRISELRLVQDGAQLTSERAVRFLAQPGTSYRVYFDPDRSAPAPVGEAGNLVGAQEVVRLAPARSFPNPSYVRADVDSDGVADVMDNCVSYANPDQSDVNENGRGDACDDFDQDGIANERDNCPNNPNRDQADEDGDGMGNPCDGAESRITEQYKWIPWLGIGFAVLVLIFLFALTARSRPPQTPQAG